METDTETKKMHGKLIFPFAEMTDRQKMHVRKAESSLREAGVKFGAGCTIGTKEDGSTFEVDRQWDLDWELEGALLTGRPAPDDA